MTTSTTAATRTSRAQQQAASGRAGGNAASTLAGPVTQWFTLASGPERGAALTGKMARLATSGKHAGMVNCTDEYGDSALYYAVVNGKPELVQWLLLHPEFSLGMAAETAQEFVARLDSDILSSSSWREAKQALAMVAEAVRALSGAEQEDSGNVQDASASSSTDSRSGNAGRSTKPPSRRGRKAGSGKHRPADRQDAGMQSEENKTNILDKFLGQYPGKAGARALASRMQQISQMFPFLVAPEFDTNALAASIDKIDPPPPSDAERIADAYKQDDVAGVRRLLRTEAGKSWARTPLGNQGHNQLMRAAFEGKAGMVEALLEVDQGALAEQASARGYTALLSAALAGHLDALKILLRFDHGRLALQATHEGCNVLMVAAEGGRNHCVKYLLAWNGGGLARHLSNKEENALFLAARNGHVDVVQTLVSHNDGALATLVSRDNSSAMTVAAECGHAQVVKLLLEWRDGSMAMLERGGFTPLLLAAQEGHVAVLQVLLESKDGPLLAKFCLQDGRNALALAERHGHVAAAQYLRAFDGGRLAATA
jgi:ankyrin repeat protein